MSQNSKKEIELTFWDHLEELRHCLLKIAVVVVVFGIVAFIWKDAVFSVIFAPKDADFITYRLLTQWVVTIPEFSIDLINTGLAQQLMTHLKVAMLVGILCASPYILYVLFHFVAPALYSSEKKYTVKAIGGGYVMFLAGVLLNYFLIFPLTFRFLGTYQVSADVQNMISLDSYISTLLMLSLMMGIVFEIPIICWLLAKFGILKARFMCQYRRHAIVAILIIAAIITPTADAFTLALVALPIYLLFEISIVVVRRTQKTTD
ncbi:MAG: twin-arginine translocase subunit TatC [Bacteroidales bacterium]|nr:twin-arginine translocase subunit TatC [Bacteroidales bacterium]